MRERDVRRGAQSLEDLELNRRIRDVILAADHMRDPEFRVVDDRGQRIGRRTIGAHQDRIAELAALEHLRAADRIVPCGLFVGDQKAPMRPAPLGLEGADLSVRQAQRGAVIDLDAASGDHLEPLELQFLLAFVAWIETARAAQRVGRRLVARKPVRLPHAVVPAKAKPAQIVLDTEGERLGGPLAIGVIESQEELPLMPTGMQPVDQRAARVSEMDTPRRAWGEPNLDHAHASALSLVTRRRRETRW